MEEVVIQINRGIMTKRYIWSPGTCNCENGKYLARIVDDLTIMCDGIIEDNYIIIYSSNKFK